MACIINYEQLWETINPIRTFGQLSLETINEILAFGHYKHQLGRNVIITDASTGETLLTAGSLYFETSYEWFERRPDIWDGKGQVLLSAGIEMSGSGKVAVFGSEWAVSNHIAQNADRAVHIYVG